MNKKKNILLGGTLKYRIETLPEVLAFHEELKKNPHHELVGFNYAVKPIKENKEVVGEYYVVTVKVKVDDEKEPCGEVHLIYEEPNLASVIVMR